MTGANISTNQRMVWLISEGLNDAFIEAIANAKVPLDVYYVKDMDGLTLLHSACYFNNYGIIKHLLEAGVDVNSTHAGSSPFRTLLSWDSRKNVLSLVDEDVVKTVKLMMKYKLRIHIDADDKTELDFILERKLIHVLELFTGGKGEGFLHYKNRQI